MTNTNPIRNPRNIRDHVIKWCYEHPNVKYHKTDFNQLPIIFGSDFYSDNTIFQKINSCDPDFTDAGLSVERDPYDLRSFVIFFDPEALSKEKNLNWNNKQTIRRLQEELSKEKSKNFWSERSIKELQEKTLQLTEELELSKNSQNLLIQKIAMVKKAIK